MVERGEKGGSSRRKKGFLLGDNNSRKRNEDLVCIRRVFGGFNVIQNCFVSMHSNCSWANPEKKMLICS
jgi:hypothetical protein